MPSLVATTSALARTTCVRTHFVRINIRTLCFLQLLKMKAKEATGAEIHKLREGIKKNIIYLTGIFHEVLISFFNQGSIDNMLDYFPAVAPAALWLYHVVVFWTQLRKFKIIGQNWIFMWKIQTKQTYTLIINSNKIYIKKTGHAIFVF